jgi:outer membrane lipoprotein
LRILCGVVALGLTGCVAVLSSQIRQRADRSIVFERLYAAPEAYSGRLVILGGEIVRLWNVPTATWLEIAHRPLDAEEQPILTAHSTGNFLVRYEHYLNPLVYSAGRVVTVAGQVVGPYIDTTGARQDAPPLLAGVEIYLWPQTAIVEVYPSAWLWWEWDPWYGGPWLWPPHRHRWWYRWHRHR